jgi:hypothetical protein
VHAAVTMRQPALQGGMKEMNSTALRWSIGGIHFIHSTYG